MITSSTAVGKYSAASTLNTSAVGELEPSILGTLHTQIDSGTMVIENPKAVSSADEDCVDSILLQVLARFVSIYIGAWEEIRE